MTDEISHAHKFSETLHVHEWRLDLWKASVPRLFYISFLLTGYLVANALRTRREIDFLRTLFSPDVLSTAQLAAIRFFLRECRIEYMVTGLPPSYSPKVFFFV